MVSGRSATTRLDTGDEQQRRETGERDLSGELEQRVVGGEPVEERRRQCPTRLGVGSRPPSCDLPGLSRIVAIVSPAGTGRAYCCYVPAMGSTAFGGLRGRQLLRDPRWNKATAFTPDEREALGLVGLLPEGTEDEDVQVERIVRQLSIVPTDLGKYILLNALLDRNETLFYRVIMSDPAQYMPIVYTPTVGEACQQFDQIMRRPRGLYLSVTGPGNGEDPAQLARSPTSGSSS